MKWIIVFALPGCACFAFMSQFDCANAYVRPAFDGDGDFKVRTNTHTPRGIAVDDSGKTLDLDHAMTALEACTGVKARACGLTVKVAPNCVQTPRGLAWPCRSKTFCAGMVQSPATAVTCEDVAATEHEFAHIVLGLPDPPTGPLLVKCKDGTELRL